MPAPSFPPGVTLLAGPVQSSATPAPPGTYLVLLSDGEIGLGTPGTYQALAHRDACRDLTVTPAGASGAFISLRCPRGAYEFSVAQPARHVAAALRRAGLAVTSPATPARSPNRRRWTPTRVGVAIVAGVVAFAGVASVAAVAGRSIGHGTGRLSALTTGGTPTATHSSATPDQLARSSSAAALTGAPAASPSLPAPARPPSPTPSVVVVAAVPVAASPGACHYRGLLPDPSCTPGALNTAVSQATITSTICVSGYTATIRPATSVTGPEKIASLAAYAQSNTPSDYEFDHLVPLELGGAANDARNLWAEPNATPNPKDSLENRLHAMVCAGSLQLAVAQRAITSDWVSAYEFYVGGQPGTEASAPPAAPTPAAAAPVQPAAPAPAAAPSSAGPPDGATARCKDGTYSFAAHHQGACSRHQGVAVFYR